LSRNYNFLLFLSVIIFLNLNLKSVTIQVPQDYETIQAAINASSKGDTILVAAGTYPEFVFIDSEKSHIIIKGAGGSITTPDNMADDSIIDGTENGRPLTIDGNYITIDGFTIINGRGEYVGGNIECQGDGCIIKNNLIMKGETESWGGYGGGIYVSASNVRILDNIIRDNWAWASGGGIESSGGHNNVIMGNTIYKNQADWAGGIYCTSESVLIKNNIIDDNYADFRNGGGILISEFKTAVIENNTIVNNVATSWGYGGGIFAVTEENSNLIILNNIISFNKNYPAGGIYLNKDENSTVQIQYNNVFNNSSDDYYGCKAGKGCISKDPLFVDQTSDYHLKSSSPCIDAGNPAKQYNDTDDTRNDLGAYGGNGEKSEIEVDRNQLNFGVIRGQSIPPQVFTISTIGIIDQEWTVSSDKEWINFNPSTGSGTALITVGIDENSFYYNSYNAEITVSSLFAVNSPQTISVLLNVYDADSTQAPFGEFSTPIEGSNVQGSIAVTGWGLDDIGLESIQVFNELNKELVYIGDAVFVDGARPDIELAYPEYPMNYKAGWGYMLLTNFLPNNGNGTFKINAIATDVEGNQVTLGTKTIQCDNANAVKPFGAIDTPTQGGTASGNNFINWGWVLTPQPNTIPIDGLTINVYVNGVNLGHPTYNIYRSDIADLFPGYNNSNGSAGYLLLDTTAYNNGVHVIQWTVRDTGGNTDGIGSRYFTIQNNGNSQSMIQNTNSEKMINKKEIIRISQDLITPLSNSEAIRIKKGLNDDIEPEIVNCDESGVYRIEIEELERIVIELSKNDTNIQGYMIVGNQLKYLPVGSIIDTKEKKFYWQPGPGFIGYYHFVFIASNEDKKFNKKNIIVKIEPKSMK